MILGLIEHSRGTLNPATFEMLLFGSQLAEQTGESFEVVLVGSSGELASQTASFGVSKVHLVTGDNLEAYAPEAWAESLVQLAAALNPQAILAASTDRGNEVMAHVAARTGQAMAANCVSVEPGDTYKLIRQRWGGSLLEEASLEGSPKLLTVAPHTFKVPEDPPAGDVPVEEFAPTLDEQVFRVQATGYEEFVQKGVSLALAPVVVGGGRGVGSAEGFDTLQELADLLSGAVGASRVATNNGWRTHADQIGQTGTHIAPKLYVACGISGAIQHMAACKGSEKILAVNTDPDAPIIAKADYAIIGDLHEVLPAIIEEVKKERG